MTPPDEYRDLWLKLDALWAEGKGESPEADEIRDRSDGPWRRMSAAERDEFRRWAAGRDISRDRDLLFDGPRQDDDVPPCSAGGS